MMKPTRQFISSTEETEEQKKTSLMLCLRYGFKKGLFRRVEDQDTGYSRLEDITEISKIEDPWKKRAAQEVEESASARFVIFDYGREIDYLKKRMKGTKELMEVVVDYEYYKKEFYGPKYDISVRQGTPISYTARECQKQFYKEIRSTYDLDNAVKKCLKRFWKAFGEDDKVKKEAELDNLNTLYSDWIDFWTEEVWAKDQEQSKKDGYAPHSELHENAQKRYYDHAMYSYNSFKKFL